MWESEFLHNVSAKDKTQDIKLNQIKLKVNNTYKKHEKITTNIEPSNPEDVINKSFLDTKLSKKQGQLSILEKHYNEKKCLATNNLRKRCQLKKT